MLPCLTKTRQIWLIAVSVAALGGCGMVGGGSKTVVEGDDNYPAAVKARYQSALSYIESGNDDRAERELENLRNAYPDYAGPLVNLGLIHARNGRPDAAMLALQRAVKLCSACAVAYNELGILERQQGNFDAAEAAYLNAINSDPQYPLAYYNLGVLYELYRGQPKKALTQYERFIEVEPSGTEAEKEVGRWVIDLRRRIARAAAPANAEVMR